MPCAVVSTGQREGANSSQIPFPPWRPNHTIPAAAPTREEPQIQELNSQGAPPPNPHSDSTAENRANVSFPSSTRSGRTTVIPGDPARTQAGLRLKGPPEKFSPPRYPLLHDGHLGKRGSPHSHGDPSPQSVGVPKTERHTTGSQREDFCQPQDSGGHTRGSRSMILIISLSLSPPPPFLSEIKKNVFFFN